MLAENQQTMPREIAAVLLFVAMGVAAVGASILHPDTRADVALDPEQWRCTAHDGYDCTQWTRRKQ